MHLKKDTKKYKQIEDDLIKLYKHLKESILLSESTESPLKNKQALEDFNKIKSASNLLSDKINSFKSIVAVIEKSGYQAETEKQLAIIQHDLNTPINIIKGYTEIFFENNVNKKNDPYYLLQTSIHENIEALSEVIQQIKFQVQSKETIKQLNNVKDKENNINIRKEKAYYRKGTILVIDDESLYLDLMRDWLGMKGHEILTAQNGEQGLQILSENYKKIDIILLDNMMPGVSGYDVLKTIKDNEEYDNISVIMLSGLYEINTIVNCIQTGAEDYILKPFNSFLLEARINICLERKYLLEKNLEGKEQLKIIANSLPVLICALDKDLTFTFNNKSYEIWFDKTVEYINGKFLKDIFPKGAYEIILHNYNTVISTKCPVNFELTLNYQKKELHYLAATLTPYLDKGEIKSTFVVMSDITNLKNTEEQLHYMATHDTLTGLPNRNLLDSTLSKAIEDAKQKNVAVAILFLDLDRFKLINDTLGHDVGDQLLIQVSERIMSNLRTTDTVIRMGGDEFVVIIRDIYNEKYVGQIAKKLCEVISFPFKIGFQTLKVSSSIGISLFPKHSTNKSALLKYADLAMYYVKEHFGNNYQLYKNNMDLRTKTKMNTLNELHAALNKKEFIIHYQPIVNPKTMQIVYNEALLRWQHGKNDLILPDDFLPLAEETGFITDLGNWVIRQVCADLNMNHSLKQIPIAINISSQQLRDAYVTNQILDILYKNNINPELIQFEMTENILAHDIDDIINKIEILKKKGIKFYIDDFGKGYSNFGYLQRLPIDGVKIDQSFVHEINKAGETNAIISTIINLVHKMKLIAIAEGVETQEQFNFLVENNCDLIQGYYIARPMPYNLNYHNMDINPFILVPPK